MEQNPSLFEDALYLVEWYKNTLKATLRSLEEKHARAQRAEAKLAKLQSYLDKCPWWYNPHDGYSLNDVMKWEPMNEKWGKYHVIGDRHLPNGIRQHLVKGFVLPGTMKDNAHVIGDNDRKH